MAAPQGPAGAPAAALPPAAWRQAGSVLLVSCYELGRPSFAVTSAFAQLEAAGFGVAAVDTAIEPLDAGELEGTRLLAISVPMLTALRLGMRLASTVRARAPQAHICMFGLYASLNAERLLGEVADSVVGGEHEEALVELARALARGQGAAGAAQAGVVARRGQLTPATGAAVAPAVLRKLSFVVPQRAGLPPAARYARLLGPGPGQTRLAGYLEASRGCLHGCRHCPVVPVYRRRFFVVPRQIVLADAAQQIAAGAEHLSFGDADFFNGPGHVMAVVRELHARHPTLSFDVTTKVSNLLRHRRQVAELGRLGCAFIISAVESLSDRVLAQLDKGHSRSDVDEALAVCRRAGTPLRPSLVPFTPWSTLEDYLEQVEWVLDEALVDHLDPVQLTIRLLIPPGSALLWQQAERPWLGDLDPDGLGQRWRHPDPRMDELQARVSELAAAGVEDDPGEVVLRLREAAYGIAGRVPPTRSPSRRRFVPRMSEPWFCCAEPHAAQQAMVAPASDRRCCQRPLEAAKRS